jgi:hypothetical protein
VSSEIITLSTVLSGPVSVAQTLSLDSAGIKPHYRVAITLEDESGRD